MNALASALLSRQFQLRPGTLVLVDDFGMKPGTAGTSGGDRAAAIGRHGDEVELTTRQVGYEAEVMHLQNPRTFYPETPSTDLAPAEARQTLVDGLAQMRATFVHDVATQLGDLAQAGARKAVVNLSIGQSEAQIVDHYCDKFLQPESSTPEQRQAYGQAFGVDLKVFGSSHPAPEQVRQLVQQVSAVVRDSSASSRFQQARAEFRQTVGQLRQADNSVVVAASNEGNIAGKLQQSSGTEPLQLGSNFAVSDLSCPEAIVVGAVAGRSAQPSTVADYTNQDPGIDLYARESYMAPTDHGTLLIHKGTSFAAPRVGVALATTHQQHPDWNSSQTQDWVIHGQTSLMPDYQGWPVRPVLVEDPQQQLERVQAA